MAVLLKHTFVSAVTDDADPNKVGSDEWNANHVGVPTCVPQGRLTLVTLTPVMVSDQTAKTTIYYTPYLGAFVPIYDGTNWTNTVFAEVSQATTDNTKSPAACANNSNYDLFVWLDSSTVRCTRGPAWTSDTGRGTGAGTTELERITGIWTNKIAITNGPAANRGTYVGTIRTDGSAQVNIIFGGTGAAGGEANVVGVWNAYNRVTTRITNFDNTDSWAYTTDTWRLKNAGGSATANRILFVIGLQEDAIVAESIQIANPTAGNAPVVVGVGFDSTSALAVGSSGNLIYGVADQYAPIVSIYRGIPAIGLHFVAPLERSGAFGTTTWVGDNNTSDVQRSLFNLEMRM